MHAQTLAFARISLVATALVLALAACGRRGPLEPPPDPSAPKQQKADDSEQSLLPTASPTGRKKAKGYTVPNQPFILDPLL